MADKKITQLTSLLATDLSPVDLLVIVDNGDIPVTKNITVGNLFTGVKTSLTAATQNTETNVVSLRSVITSNIALTSAATIRAAEFSVNAITGSTNTAYQYAVVASSGLANTAKVTIEHAVAKFVLNLANTASPMVTNTYGLLIEVANTSGSRTVNAQSFIALGDLTSNSTTAQTLYLVDVGKNGTANVSANVGDGGATNVSVLFSNTALGSISDITHKLRIRVNGEDFYLLLSNTAGVL